MASTSLKPDEYLKHVLSDVPNSIEKEQAMSLSTSPLLAAYYAWLRKINGLHNKTDIDVENKQFVSDFIYLCNHNLIFCLTVMGRFDLLRELFQAVTPSKDELYLIELIKREQQIFKNNETQAAHKAPLISTLPSQDAQWTQYVVALSNVHMMHFYQEEIKRVHYEHQILQTELFSQAFQTRLDRMVQALEFIENDAQFSPEVKAEARELVNRFIVEQERVHTAHQESQKNPQDLHTIQLERQIAEQLYVQSNQLYDFMRILSKTHHHSDLNTLIKTEKKEAAEVKKNAERNEQQWKQQLKDLVQLSHRFTQQVKKDQLKQLDQVIKIAKNCPREHLTPVQQQHLERVIVHMKDLRGRVNTMVRFEDLQSALKEWYQQLNSLEHLFNATQSAPVIQEFAEAVKDIRGVIAEAGQLKSVYHTPATHSQVQPHPPTTIGFFAHAEVTPQGPAADEKGVTDSRVFKLRKLEVTEGEEVLELDERMMNELIKTIEALRNDLSYLKDNDELTENDLKLTHEIENVILKKFESIGSNGVSASSINKLYEALDKFEQEHDSFIAPKATLSKIIDSFASQFNPENQAHI